MPLSNIAGFPRIGPNRELKFATEGYWRGDVSLDELQATATRIRTDNWRFMREAGVDLIPSNDFSLYDHVLDVIEGLLPVYGEVIERLAEQGATWVQLDEPCFVEDRAEHELDALRLVYEELAKVHERTRICVKTYFDHVGEAYGVLRDLPVEGIGLDFHRGGPDLDREMVRKGGPRNVEFIATDGGLEDKWLFAGVVDGRNVWINELEHSLDLLGGIRDRCKELVVSTSCSLLHTPLDLDNEPP